MNVKIITPKKTVSWTETLRSIAPGQSGEVKADYRETTSIRVAASKLTREGFSFRVSKKDETTTIIERVK